MSDPEKTQQALRELWDIVRCRCHEAYTGRGLHDPNCECDSADAVKVVADRIEALTEQLAAARRDAEEAEAYAGELEVETWKFHALHQNEVAIAALPSVKVGVKPPFYFDRYINGVRMAEDVCVEREATLEGAMLVAARIVSKGPNGEAPVLVYRAPVTPATDHEALLKVTRIHDEVETKLAKAVEVAEKSIKWLRLYGADVHREATTLAELKGEK